MYLQKVISKKTLLLLAWKVGLETSGQSLPVAGKIRRDNSCGYPAPTPPP